MRKPRRSDDEKSCRAEISEVISKEESGKRCTICLDKYRVGDMIGFCINKHIYHHKCLWRWLQVSSIPWCPECRSYEGFEDYQKKLKDLRFDKECEPCLITNFEELVRSSRKMKTLRLVREDKVTVLQEQERFRSRGQDYNLLARHSGVIQKCIRDSKLIDITAACGTGKSTVLPLIVNETLGVDLVYILEPRKHLAVENALQCQKVIGNLERNYVTVSHCTKSEALPQFDEGICFFSAGKMEQQLEVLFKSGVSCAKVVLVYSDWYEFRVHYDDCIRKGAKLLKQGVRLVFCSAFPVPAILERYFRLFTSSPINRLEVVTNPSRTESFNIVLPEPHKRENVEASLVASVAACLCGGFKCVLVWSLGEKDTLSICRNLKKLVCSSVAFDQKKIQIIPLSAQSTTEMIKIICRQKVQEGEQRVVVSTAKGQVGHTIKDCDVCVDSGLGRVLCLNRKTNMMELSDLPLTEWDLIQRVGRVARDTDRGIYLLLQSESFRAETRFVTKKSPPGISTEMIGKWIMKVLARGGNPYTEPYPWKRSYKHTQYCSWILHTLGVLRANHYQTGMTFNWEYDKKLTRAMLRLPLSPRNAIMFINSHFTSPEVTEDISILIAMMQIQPFLDSFYKFWSLGDIAYSESVKKPTFARRFLLTQNGRFLNSTLHRLVGLYRYASQWYDGARGGWSNHVENIGLSRKKMTEVTAMIGSLRRFSLRMKANCDHPDKFFCPSKWLGVNASKKENFEAVVARAYAMQLACGKKNELLEYGKARMVESGLVVSIKKAELNLLKTSIENVNCDDKDLFFVFLRAKSKYGGYTEVSDVLPLCDKVGKGIRTLVVNLKRRKVGRRPIPSVHTFTFDGNEGMTFDYEKYETIKNGRQWNEK